MAKFKVGDRVRVFQTKNYVGLSVGCLGTIICINVNGTYSVLLDDKTIHRDGLVFYENELELVEPKVESTYKKPLIFSPFSKHDIYVNGKVRTYGVETIEQPCTMPHEPKQLKVTFIEHTEKLQSQELPKVEQKQDEAFKLDPHEFDYQRNILGVRRTPILKGTLETLEDIINFGIDVPKPKNRIPDRVVFNQDKGKVTVLISKFNDGVAPYRAYTSKVNVEGGDKYDGQFGFLLSYYKYLIRMYGKDKQRELIERIFNLLPTKRYPYLLGAVETEVMKISDVIKTYKDWEDIYLAITEPTLKKNGTFDYLEWKEMLRVHELETKREKQREVAKEIKKHQKEIERLKKEV